MNPPLDLPMDVRLMNVTASAFFVLCGLGLFLALGAWCLRHPFFELRGIVMAGDVGRHSAAQVRANVAPKLSGNFLTLDLRSAQAAFEALPWVRRAIVQREFPGRLRVTLEEHRAIAYWGPENGSKLVNAQGEIFEANPDEAERDDLPRLLGPDTEVAAVLSAWRAWTPILKTVAMDIEWLEMSPSGAWRMRTDAGTHVEIGRGSPDELAQRLLRWVRVVTPVAAHYGRRADAIETADLRYAQGFAVRVRGVGTAPPTPAAAGRK